MKSNRVLFGLFAAVLALSSGAVMAQRISSSKLVEIGPDNIGGRITSLIVDQRDPSHNTVFAGSAHGGLYVRSNSSDYAEFPDVWNYIPTADDPTSNEYLPISCMVQGSDNTIYIGTGEGSFQRGSRFSAMASRGRGLYLFNPDTKKFKCIEKTIPANMDDTWSSINKLAVVQDGGTTYVFAATHKGLYRFDITKEEDWTKDPILIAAGSVEIFDIAVNKEHSLLYFAAADSIYKLSSFSSKKVVNITANNTPSSATFTSASRIYLKTSVENPDYLYAMVINSSGAFGGLYLTTNQSEWKNITTATVLPFNYNKGTTCGAICVDENYAGSVYIGGSSIYKGVKYDGFQWTKSSLNEHELGATNYMGNVYCSSSFIHSGVNDIVQTKATDEDGNVSDVFYVATNGGVYMTDDGFATIQNINRGLNNLEVNGLAVATDGSVLAGAYNNANVFIESRDNHYFSSVPQGTGVREQVWYDRNGSGMNHRGNVIFEGNGGQVAISRFQQYAPLSRRTLYVSANNGSYGRGYADYLDYTNTQTWTTGLSFVGGDLSAGNEVAQMQLWETDAARNVSSISHLVDTNDVVYRRGVGKIRVGLYGSNMENSCNGVLKAGDTILVPNVATASYPITHVFTERQIIEEGTRIKVDNPIQSHLYILGRHTDGSSNMTYDKINMTWMPSDFTKVYEPAEGAAKSDADYEKDVTWGEVYSINRTIWPNRTITTFAVSEDGDVLLAVVANTKNDSCFIARVKGMRSLVDYSLGVRDIATQLTHKDGNGLVNITLKCDTLKYNSDIWLPRHVSSITMDQRGGRDRAILTFEGYGKNFDNVMIVNDVTKPSYAFVDGSLSYRSLKYGKVPTYCAMVEMTTGDVFLGTEEGLFRATASSVSMGRPNWETVGEFQGVPVTCLTQQKFDMELKRMEVHSAINTDNYVFPRTKYPGAIYIGTYGAGIWMDSSYVTRHENEVVDDIDYVGIAPVLSSKGQNSVKIYPNPAVAAATSTLQLNVLNGGTAEVKVYDLRGRMVENVALGVLTNGTYRVSLDNAKIGRGMYLVNVVIGNEVATAKFVVR
ncbi:MAG: T9SS type A sorting domain-containing protein [Bacteroidales bacterium]|nr:T9SS type A sorting domain-containing protein [Candidatus Colimorpha onthohippi]